MSTDDFYQDPVVILDKWLNQPEGAFGSIIDYVDPNNLSIVKQAFLDGYKLGFETKGKILWQEQNQK